MKISYERLNQIIEEEVVRFKKLNEQALTPEQKLVNEIEAYLSVLVKNKKTSDLSSLRDDIKRRAGV